ncbi:hypothetical protein H8E77_17720 [bacterium]|nr:hypothetical protein [bacterium]
MNCYKIFKKYRVGALITVLPLLVFWAMGPAEVCGDDLDITNSQNFDVPGNEAISLSPWYTIHGNKQRTKWVNGRGVLDPVERFHYESNDEAILGVSVLSSASTFPDEIPRFYRMASVDNGKINYVEVINTQTGKVEYVAGGFNFGFLLTTPTVLPNGDVIIADYGRIFMYTPDLKHCLWTRRLRDQEPGNDVPLVDLPMVGADILPDGRLLVATGGGMVYILGRRFGNIISKFNLRTLEPPIKLDPQQQCYLRNLPAFDRNLVFFVVYEEVLLFEYVPRERKLVFLDRYHYNDNQLSSTSPCVDRIGKRVFFCSFPYDNPELPSYQYAVNYENEKLSLRWSYSGIEVQPGVPERADQVANTYNRTNGFVIFNNWGGIATAFREVSDRNNVYPEIAWRTPHDDNYATAVAGKDNIVYSGDMENMLLYALDGDTGEPIWTMPVPGEHLIAKIMVVDDGVVYYDYSYGLYAIEQSGANAPAFLER